MRSLAEWTAIKEEFEEEEKGDDFEDELEDAQEEVMEEANEGEMLVLRGVWLTRSDQKMSKERTYCIPIVQFKWRFVLWLLMEEAVQMWFL